MPGVSTPVPAALAALAAARPDAAAVTDQTGTLTRGELERDANRLARCYLEHGVALGDVVTIALPSDRSLVTAVVAAWKVGATPQAVSPTMPPRELEAIVTVSRPALVVGVDLEPAIPSLASLSELGSWSADPLPAVTSPAWKAPVSGGSSGLPKVIVSTTPAEVERLLPLAGVLRMRPDDVVLAPAPLHHNGPFLFGLSALLLGGHLVLPGRFDALRTLQLVEAHSVGWAYLVPTMMSRISKLTRKERSAHDLSSLHTVFHMAAPCPPWLKREWLAWLGPDRVWELYAGTEAQAVTLISGTEWLEHVGSVGRPLVGEIVVLDHDGSPAPAGQVGEIWMRPSDGPTYRYLGAEPKRRDDGWESLGDLGWFDQDGYLYLADRLADMVLVGGVNVYPAEVEAALDEHPQVLSSCAIGLPDDDLGNRIHALVQIEGELSDEQLHAWCAERLTRHKVPRTFERVTTPLRDEAAKVRRSALRDARLQDAM
jgi:bile acid-coenzyme A ligase